MHELATKISRNKVFIGRTIDLLHSRPMFWWTNASKIWTTNAKGTRIQTNDVTFANQFEQRCIGHDCAHATIEGGKVTRDTAFYPKSFCQRAVQLWKIPTKRHRTWYWRNLKKQEKKKKQISCVIHVIRQIWFQHVQIATQTKRCQQFMNSSEKFLTTTREALKERQNGDCNVYTEIWAIHPTVCSFKY